MSFPSPLLVFRAPCQISWGSRDCRVCRYICMYAYMRAEEEQQLKTGGSGWRCNVWHCCLCTTDRDEAGGLCSSRYLGWSTEGHCWEHGTVSWVRGRAVCTGRLLAACVLHYQDYIWHQNQRSWLSLLFFLCFQDLNNCRLFRQFVWWLGPAGVL